MSKPCDAERLRSVIERTCRLQQLLVDGDIRSIVGRLNRLPSAPETYWELTRAAASNAAGVTELARIIAQDPAMSIKVLQLVNSAYFGLPQTITSVKQRSRDSASICSKGSRYPSMRSAR